MGVDMMRYKKYKEFLKEQDVGRDTKEKDSKNIHSQVKEFLIV